MENPKKQAYWSNVLTNSDKSGSPMAQFRKDYQGTDQGLRQSPSMNQQPQQSMGQPGMQQSPPAPPKITISVPSGQQGAPPIQPPVDMGMQQAQQQQMQQQMAVQQIMSALQRRAQRRRAQRAQPITFRGNGY